MVQPVSPDEEANSASPVPDTQAEFGTESQRAAPISTIPSTPELFSSRALSDMQEKMREYLYESLRSLESQLKVEQQRQRDRVEEELHKMRQQVATAIQEQRQQYQNMSSAVREMFDEMRKELSDALQRASQDVNHTMRQSEAHNRQAIEKLRNEVFQGLFQRDQGTVKRDVLGDLLITLGKRLQTAAEGQDI